MLKWFLNLCFIPAILCSMQLPTVAQITPDASLGAEQSTLSPANTIGGGARRGANLFHSFSEFNIGDQQRIDFANPAGVDRILARVTGGTRSQILGTLGVLGNADLFLLNPNGITFGANAQLDVRGSFTASTANTLNFDGFAFSTTNPQLPSLLTISVPLGLQYPSNPGSIRVQGATLQVPDTKRLALGGNISLEGATLRTPSGQVELGDAPQAEVSLSTGSAIRVRGTGSGNIVINAQNITLTEDSRLIAGIAVGVNGKDSPIGNIQLTATEAITLSDSAISMLVSSGAIGKGGNIDIRANSLAIIAGGQTLNTTEGKGDAGDVKINVTNQVRLGEISPAGFVAAIASSADTGATGNAGNINISARELSLADRAGIQTFVERDVIGKAGDINITTEKLALTSRGSILGSSFGLGDSGNISIKVNGAIVMNTGGVIAIQINPNAIGDVGNLTINAHSLSLGRGGAILANGAPQKRAGNITINARDFVHLIGVITEGVRQPFSSGLYSDTDVGSSGESGSIQVNTPDLLIADGAIIDARSRNAASGGNIEVNVDRLRIVRGGQILTTAQAGGKAGDIAIQASSEIVLAGRDPGFEARAAQFENLVGALDGISGILANTTTESTGIGGNIFIRSGAVRVQEGARIAVDSRGTGAGGRIQLEANSLTLSDRAAISAQTQSNTGGNITLTVPDLVLLRRGSSISTTAGIAQGNGDGGNINLSAGFIVAVPNENSDITADAFRGNGGNIAITAQNIFGIDFRDRQTESSDITASSQFGINGSVTLNQLALDPTPGTNELPTRFSSPPVAQGCQASSRTSRFVNQGRGGVSTSPADPLVAETIWQDWELIDQPQAKHNPEIVEAQGWVKQSDGTVALVHCSS